MDLGFIPVAEASVATLMKSINRVVINPLILFLFAVAMVYFLYGLAQYFLNPNSEEIRKSSKSHMLWGIIGLFIMVAVFGIMRLILGTVGENTIKIDSTGDYTINQGALNSNDTDNSTIKEEPFIFVGDSFAGTGGGTVNVTPYLPRIIDESDLRVPSEILALSVSDNFYHRAYGSGKSTTLRKAQDIAIYNARIRIATEKGVKSVDAVMTSTMLILGQQGFDTKDGFYHVFVAASSPKDLPLSISNESELVIPLQKLEQYTSTATFYKTIGSGKDTDLANAKKTAIRNALIRIAKLKGVSKIDALPYTILEEKAYDYNGYKHYFVALSSPR
ncbi:MAG: hypothetical protein WC059_01860 [Candidatus Paceibacterota bacterium]